MLEEILKGNKIISDFMDIHEITIYYNSYGNQLESYRTNHKLYQDSHISHTYSKPGLSMDCFYSDAKYHSSYDWLIPVYNKIVREELYGDNEEGIVLFNIMYDRIGDADDILEVWKSIVDFIEWYNLNK